MRGLLNARHKKCILERRYLPAEGVQEGVRCVGRSEVCGKERCVGRSEVYGKE